MWEKIMETFGKEILMFIVLSIYTYAVVRWLSSMIKIPKSERRLFKDGFNANELRFLSTLVAFTISWAFKFVMVAKTFEWYRGEAYTGLSMFAEVLGYVIQAALMFVLSKIIFKMIERVIEKYSKDKPIQG